MYAPEILGFSVSCFCSEVDGQSESGSHVTLMSQSSVTSPLHDILQTQAPVFPTVRSSENSLNLVMEGMLRYFAGRRHWPLKVKVDDVRLGSESWRVVAVTWNAAGARFHRDRKCGPIARTSDAAESQFGRSIGWFCIPIINHALCCYFGFGA